MSENDAFLLSPLCNRLRSKKYFFLETPPRTESDILDGSNDCWCGKTLSKVGADGNVARPAECQDGRACFEPYRTTS